MLPEPLFILFTRSVSHFYSNAALDWNYVWKWNKYELHSLHRTGAETVPGDHIKSARVITAHSLFGVCKQRKSPRGAEIHVLAVQLKQYYAFIWKMSDGGPAAA